MIKVILRLTLLLTLLYSEIPDRRVVAEWEPALGTIIRWPLGIPASLVIELASEDILYVLVETNNHQNQATNSFNSWGVNFENVVFIFLKNIYISNLLNLMFMKIVKIKI